jgi:hypothetical protein
MSEVYADLVGASRQDLYADQGDPARERGGGYRVSEVEEGIEEAVRGSGREGRQSKRKGGEGREGAAWDSGSGWMHVDNRALLQARGEGGREGGREGGGNGIRTVRL